MISLDYTFIRSICWTGHEELKSPHSQMHTAHMLLFLLIYTDVNLGSHYSIKISPYFL